MSYSDFPEKMSPLDDEWVHLYPLKFNINYNYCKEEEEGVVMIPLLSREIMEKRVQDVLESTE